MLLTDAAQQALIAWRPSDDEEMHRCCYVTPQVMGFFLSPAAQVRDRAIRLTAGQQLASKLDAFVSGDSLAALGWADTPPPFRKLRPKDGAGHCVWEMRTLDVRLFGWFPGPPNTWIGIKAVLKRDLLLANGADDEDAYAACRDEVAAWRQAHGMTNRVWRLMDDDLPLHLKR